MMSRLAIPLAFTAFWLFFMVVGQSKLLRDPGTLWHTKVGEKVLTEGFFVGDPYTFTHASTFWVPHQWLGEVVMASAYRAGGFDAFILLAATILATLLTVLTLRLLKTGLNPVVCAVVMGLCLAALATHLHVRPLLMTTVSMTIVAVLLCDCDTGKTPLRTLAWLVPLFIAWTNTHGGMLGGLASLGLVFAGWIIAAPLGWPSPASGLKAAAGLLLLLLLCGLSMFANPYGWETPKAWLSIMRAPKIPQLIEEHQPLDPSKPTAWALLAFASLYLFVLAGIRGKPRVTWLLPLFWLAQSFFRVRHAPLFAVTAMVAITTMWPATRWALFLAKHRPDLYKPSVSPRFAAWSWCVPLVLVALCLALQHQKVVAPIIGSGWARLDSEHWPIEITDAVKNIHGPIFNDCANGGFLIFFAPQCRIFIDDRAELYGEDFMDEFVRGGAIDTEAALDRWEKRFGEFQHALVKPDTEFAKAFEKRGWTVVASCRAGVLYRR